MSDGWLAGRTALVTGAGRMRGTGRSIALALAAHGADVVLHGRDESGKSMPSSERDAGWRGLASVADEVTALGRAAHIVTADLRDSAAVDRMIAEAISAAGSLEILVNNAAAPSADDRVPVADLTDGAWSRVIEVKLNGAMYCSRAFARHRSQAGGGGRIVNISSTAGNVPQAGGAAYGVANAGLQMLGGALAQELGGIGITVNTLCVGVVDTSRIDGMGRGAEFDAFVAQTIPLGRAGSPEDVGELTAFLCSDAAGYVTGANIPIDGGFRPR